MKEESNSWVFGLVLLIACLIMVPLTLVHAFHEMGSDAFIKAALRGVVIGAPAALLLSFSRRKDA
jgi:hypothetical protein